VTVFSRRWLLGAAAAALGGLVDQRFPMFLSQNKRPKPPHGGGGGGDSLPPQTGAVTISSGGTYTLNVLVTDSTVNAVTISTTAPVTIINSFVQHAGRGIWAPNTGTQLTVKNSTFTAITPSTSNPEQQVVNAWEPLSLTVEHNNLNYGHGIQVSTATYNVYQTTTLSISYNNFTNIGKLSQPGIYQGAVHLDKVTAPDGKILWNRVTNSYGSSWGEDIIAVANSKGNAGHLLEVGHNLVNGAYPFSGNGASYTGGAIDLEDIAGGYIKCNNCYVRNYTNNGIMKPTNAPGVTIDSCVAVYDGIANDESTTVSSTFGWGMTVKNLYDATGTQSVVTNCRVGHRRWNGSAFEGANYQWENQGTQDGGGNTTLTANSTNEQAMIAEFEASVGPAGVTIGPI
jgi:hypothetical protein